ncbi:MAG: methylenetetrahydrofolate reductase C-terminal domain-containing protein [Chloroflexota bacterium]
MIASIPFDWRRRFVDYCETAFGGNLFRAILWAEHKVKGPVFGCQMCGQCALQYTGFVCSMQCPKQLRNGPCGGAAEGHCEVYPDRMCVWVRAYDRSRLLHREEMLEKLQPTLDWRLFGTSAWLNHLAERDAHLWTPEPERLVSVWELPAQPEQVEAA